MWSATSNPSPPDQKSMARVALYVLIVALGIGLAFLRGRRVTKIVAVIILLGNLLTAAVEYSDDGTFLNLSLIYLGLDAGLVIVLIGIAVWRPCWLTICVAAFQLNGFLGHLVKLLELEMFPVSYAILLKLWAWPMALTLLAASLLPTVSRTLDNRDWPFGRARR